MSQDTFKDLYVRGELGATRQASHDEILSAARSIMSRKVRRGTSMSSPKLVKDFLTTKLGTLEHETFCVILLDLCRTVSNVLSSVGAQLFGDDSRFLLNINMGARIE